MSRKQRQPADGGMVEFEIINREIDLLMKRLHGKKSVRAV
jgi:hypothetical protein